MKTFEDYMDSVGKYIEVDPEDMLSAPSYKPNDDTFVVEPVSAKKRELLSNVLLAEDVTNDPTYKSYAVLLTETDENPVNIYLTKI